MTWFGHDKIDLDSHFDDPIHCAVYAYTTFTMARPDSVRFWLGSDEDLAVWIDGEPLYEFEGRRSHMLGQVQLPGYLEAGEHRILVRASQRRGRFDFSFNVCEPIDDPRFAGNRYPGVRYSVTGADPLSPAARVRSEDIYDGWFSEERAGDLGGASPSRRPCPPRTRSSSGNLRGPPPRACSEPRPTPPGCGGPISTASPWRP